MEMITTVPTGGKILIQVPRRIMCLQDIEAVCRVIVKYLNGMHMVLHFRNEKSNPVWIQSLVPQKILHNILLHLTSPDPS